MVGIDKHKIGAFLNILLIVAKYSILCLFNFALYQN